MGPIKGENPLHKKVIIDFLNYLNSQTDQFILKGGTALMLCYGLDRFFEDIDLDGFKQIPREIIRRFCTSRRYSFTNTKDTQTVKRYMIDCGIPGTKLKIEVYYRNKAINNDDSKIYSDPFGKNVRVYKLDPITDRKIYAYLYRDKIRDLYDLCFLVKNYYDKLSEPIKSRLSDVFLYKGFEYVGYLVKTQKDSLINGEKLSNDFLDVYDRLGQDIQENDNSIKIK